MANIDSLLLNFENALAVDTVKSVSEKRKGLFKSCGITELTMKEKRRIELLERYKRDRASLLDKKRKLLNDRFEEQEGEWMDWQEVKEKGHKGLFINKNCKNQLMLSEWLLDRPHDLESSWTCVLCPEGRRTLVVATQGYTKAYHKSGTLLAKFKSILPNGSPDNLEGKKSNVIILDCIWRKSTKQLFALDVLNWSQHPLLDCDAKFRLYWVLSKLNDVKSAAVKSADEGVYDVFLPPHCQFSRLPQVLEEYDPSEVDGILFYHNEAPYVSGQTPLVGWLKPYMLAERFNLTVPSKYLALRPENYCNLEKWVETVSHGHIRKPDKNKQVVMECSEESSGSATTLTSIEMEAAST